MQKKYHRGLMWFRRDLRAEDNAALSQALMTCDQVFCVFIFDKAILEGLPKADRRVEFIRESLSDLDHQLRALVADESTPERGLIVQHADAAQAIPRLARALNANAVFINQDDEPAAITRDSVVLSALAEMSIDLRSFKDHVVLARQEVLTLAGKPYSVFTPYKNAWLKKISQDDLAPHQVAEFAGALAPIPKQFQCGVPTLEELGFEKTNLSDLKIYPGAKGGAELLNSFLPRMHKYKVTRDFPAVKGPSYLGVHLRFGTVSIRQLARHGLAAQHREDEGAATWLSELIWRDFYAQILSNFPHAATQAFKPEYDAIQWEAGALAETRFQAWCQGETGYPLVDAAMAQINQTGYMHNRLRMVTASFLVKDLGIDWRWGERYFAEKLNDFDLSANNGGWQWAASSGCDAQPYFRIFNPTSQSEKFDADGKFIRRYLPALARLSNKSIHCPSRAGPLELSAAGVVLGDNYPHPLVVHDEARAITLQRYSVLKKTTL